MFIVSNSLGAEGREKQLFRVLQLTFVNVLSYIKWGLLSLPTQSIFNVNFTLNDMIWNKIVMK